MGWGLPDLKQEQPGVSALWLSWQAARDKEEGAQESGEDREQGGKMWSAPRAASILPYSGSLRSLSQPGPLQWKGAQENTQVTKNLRGFIPQATWEEGIHTLDLWAGL